MLTSVRVVQYDAAWPRQFAVAAALLAPVFGAEATGIHHVGSTSIPGMCAKPIIDILLTVSEIAAVDSLNPALMALGFDPQGEYGIPGRRFFIKGGDAERTHNLHVFQHDHPEVRAMLDFRDYLIAHLEEARRYACLKDDLARRFPADITGYLAGKDAFIKETIRKAAAWRGSSPHDNSPS